MEWVIHQSFRLGDVGSLWQTPHHIKKCLTQECGNSLMRDYFPRVAGIQRLLVKPVFQRSRLNIRTGKVKAESCPSSWFYKRCQTRWNQLSQDKDWGHLHPVGLLEFPQWWLFPGQMIPPKLSSRTYENSFFKRTPSITECTKGQWSRFVLPYCGTSLDVGSSLRSICHKILDNRILPWDTQTHWNQ